MLQRLRHAVGWGLPAPPPGTRVDFQVCAPLGHGQTLYLVGDLPALGGSVDVIPSIGGAGAEGGLQLVTTPDLYPIWYNLEPVVAPAGAVVRYRYAVCSGSRFLRYEGSAESGPVTRELTVGVGYVQTQDTLDARPRRRSSLCSEDEAAANGRADDASASANASANANANANATRANDAVIDDDDNTENKDDDDDHPTNDDDDEDVPPPAFWGVIPRLSSGQAFVDRRANGSEESGTGSIWTHRAGAGTGGRRPPGSGRLLAATIAEEGEAADPTTASPTLGPRGRRMRSGSIPPPVEDASPAPSSATSRLGGGRAGRRMSDEFAATTSPASPRPLPVAMEATDGVIIAVHRLPVLVHRTPAGEYLVEWEDDNLICPSGLLKDSYREANWDRVSSMRLTWVGTVHCAEAIPKADEERLAKQLEEFHCVPVFLSEPLGATFHAFCYGTLWPIFHNIVDVFGALPTRWWNPGQQKAAWASYKTVNRIFVNKVIEVYNDGDLVWLHGLHLLVAPSFLARRLPCVNVGLFLHTPFPSSEIFRTLSVRADLLRGVLAADHIGFHLYEHARHFLTSCRRILGLKYSAQPGGYIGVEYNGRVVMLTISHIGIEPSFMDRIAARPQVQQDVATLAAKYESSARTVFVSVDRVERLKGILLKVGAIEFFLAQHPEFVARVQFVQIGIWDSSNPTPEKDSVRAEILSSAARINARFGAGRKEPLFAYSEVENTDMASRLPLWRVGHVLLTTSVRDAVNLYPFEFIYAHELARAPGVVIVSEFSGSSRVLTGSVGVNPWKRDEIVQAMELALVMTPEERAARHRKDLEYITTNSRTKWAERILVDLKRTKKQAAEGEYMGYGLGLGFRMLEFNAGFKMLETETVAKAYRETFRRVILFDYGNTLTLEEPAGAHNFAKYITDSETNTFVSKTETPRASSDLLASLSLLCADPRNTVFVLSGKERCDLEKTLGSVRGLGLAAEHGYLYKWGTGMNASASAGSGSRAPPSSCGSVSSLGSDVEEGVWLCTKDNFDDSWKDVTHAVMDIYTQRTHGTYIELKGSALLWQYRDADPEFGQLQAKELHDQLTQVLEHFQVEVVTGTDYLEVRPEGVDKGVIVDRIMSTIESTSGQYADFILCMGDDLSDEFMFQYLEDVRPRPNLFTVTVGKKPSAAKFFVNDVDQVTEILHAMTRVSTAAKRNFSMSDLRSFDRSLPPSGGLLAFQRAEMAGYNRPSGNLGYQSEGSFEGVKSSPFGEFVDIEDEDATASTENPLVSDAPGSIGTRGIASRGGLGGLGRNSMSMSSLSTAVTRAVPPTSATYEQYFSNIDETGENEEGGIFF